MIRSILLILKFSHTIFLWYYSQYHLDEIRVFHISTVPRDCVKAESWTSWLGVILCKGKFLGNPLKPSIQGPFFSGCFSSDITMLKSYFINFQIIAHTVDRIVFNLCCLCISGVMFIYYLFRSARCRYILLRLGARVMKATRTAGSFRTHPRRHDAIPVSGNKSG